MRTELYEAERSGYTISAVCISVALLERPGHECSRSSASAPREMQVWLSDQTNCMRMPAWLAEAADNSHVSQVSKMQRSVPCVVVKTEI